MSAQELPVIRKTYELVLWSCGHTSKFRRSHRFVLGERIERNLYDLLETLIKARYTREQHGLLGQAKVGEPKFAVCEENGRFSNGGSMT
jgi:hypothetical protein